MEQKLVGTKITEDQKTNLEAKFKAAGFATWSEFLRALMREWESKQEKAA